MSLCMGGKGKRHFTISYGPSLFPWDLCLRLGFSSICKIRPEYQNIRCLNCCNSLRGSSLGRSGGGEGKAQKESKKESLQLRVWNLNICIEKVDAKC